MRNFNIPKTIMWFTALLFVTALILTLWILKPSDGHLVEVVQDDRVLYTFDLDFAEDKTITVFYDEGSYNTISIRNGEICVSEAGCPDQICVKTGKLHSKNLPIVCMPNHLIIRFVK